MGPTLLGAMNRYQHCRRLAWVAKPLKDIKKERGKSFKGIR